MKKLAIAPSLLLALWVSACGDSTSAPGPSRVIVSPFTNTMVAIGETVQYSARLEDDRGSEITGATFTWSISNSQVASITSSGLLTGLKAGTATVRASAEGITGSASLSIDPVPDALLKVSGDEQEGTLRQVLPEQITIEVQDANGHPVEGKFVTFSVLAGGGTATPFQARTGSDGRASTVWRLGCSNDNPQRLAATIGGLTASFTSAVDLNALAICQESVPDGRETQVYSTQLVAAGGDQGSLAWSVLGGALPPGLNLGPGGEITGTPSLAGTFSFLARVQDGAGGDASSNFSLRICEAPIALAPGESTAFDPATLDECGFYLPAGDDGDRYRFAVVYGRPDTASADVPTVTVGFEREAGGVVGSASLVSGESFKNLVRSPSLSARDAAMLREATDRRMATMAYHVEVRQAERELMAALGPDVRPLPDRRPSLQRAAGAVAGAVPQGAASPAAASFKNSTSLSSCDLGETRRAVLVKENDYMVIYQDSIQRASDPLPDAQAQALLDHYEAYGHQVIQKYFGGVSDIDGNGKIIVFVTPKVEEDVAAYVWSGDFFPLSSCQASNEMELMRFNLKTIKEVSEGNFQALGTAVHEAKHVSSLYKSLGRFNAVSQTDYYQPTWVEEGTAELAEERAARIAWAMTGGPGMGAMADEDDVRALGSFTKEMYSTILTNAGAKGYLSSQPNSVVTDPVGASSIHSIYGSGWHFHRWLGDAYGNAQQAMADSALSRVLNDSTTATGSAGILAATGAPSWITLLEEYAVAIMLNGTGAPESARAFTSYDFPSFHRTFEYTQPGLEPEGDYPWPVNTVGESATSPFQSASNIGPIGPSGIRIFDLTSNGTGLGLVVSVSTSAAVGPFRIVLVRVE